MNHVPHVIVHLGFCETRVTGVCPLEEPQVVVPVFFMEIRASNTSSVIRLSGMTQPIYWASSAAESQDAKTRRNIALPAWFLNITRSYVKQSIFIKNNV